MYTDRLTTPHTDISEFGVTPEPILDSTRFKMIKEVYQSSEQSYDDRVEAANATADLVRRTLRFEKHTSAHPPFSPEMLGQTQRTNCHGHSIVTSECLDEVGVDHWISFANQHSFIVLEDELQHDGVSHRVNLLDTAEKHLYIDMTSAFAGTALAKQGGEYGAVNTIRGDIILERSHFANKEAARAERLWMSFASESSRRFKDEMALRRDNILVMRSYRPEQGRALLASYTNFVHAVLQREFWTAHQNLTPLGGLYPDIDRRNKLVAPTQTIRALGQTGEIAAALDDVRIIEESLWPTEDLTLRLWPADQRRRLGMLAGSADLIDASIEAYEEIIDERSKQRKSTVAVRGRLAKTQRQRAQLFIP
ncbi:MAG TPA: hypothetical protein PKD28_00015 [Candidatus Saccharibacteria bacterium]|nr:hypothetical protein [Candidatus Saccharibacteria bacterium]